jgi:asparagine synthase (glutamine-hydrolysing)
MTTGTHQEFGQQASPSAFFHLRKVHGRWEANGTPACLLAQHTHATSQREGAFAEWSWDGQRLVVGNDRYGFYPLFYFSRPDEFCISGSIPTLLKRGAPTQLDATALAVILRLGYFVGEDTPFKAIRLVPPGARMQWENGSFSVAGEIPVRCLQELSREAALDAFIELMRQAIARRAAQHEDFVATISGGRDSRHILLGLCDSGKPPKFAVSVENYQPWPSPDTEVAAKVCQELGMRLVILQQDSSMFQAELRKNLKTSFSTLEHAWLLKLSSFLKGQTHAVYEGVAGDILTGESPLGPTVEWQKLVAAGKFEEFADGLLDKDERMRAQLLQPEWNRECGREIAIQRVAEEVQKHADAAIPTSSFFLFNRTRRVTSLSPMSLLREVGTVFTPYLDHDVYNLLASLPVTVLLDHKFHSDAMRKAYPRMAHIPFAQKQLQARQCYRFFLRLALELGRFSLRSTRTRLLRRSFLLPRLARCVVDPSYSVNLGWLGDMSTYLIHLECAVAGEVLELD